MTIYDLLKNSSPSMAKHFKETEEGAKKNTEDITALKTRVTTLEEGGSGGSGATPTLYEPYTHYLNGQNGFELKNKQINNTSYQAYYLYKSVSTTGDKTYKHIPLFAPHCEQFVNVNDEEVTGSEAGVYIPIPIMDFENEVYLNPDKLGIAIKRQYNDDGILGDIDILVTKKLYDSLALGSSNLYIVHL